MTIAGEAWDRLLAIFPEQGEVVPDGREILEAAYLQRHGKFDAFIQAVEAIKPLVPEIISRDYKTRYVTAKTASHRDISEEMTQLMAISPWRKGPFSLAGIDIDSEWHCDLKYQRLQQTGIDFHNKTVLDVGSGNGYYLFRILGDGAKCAIGMDPSWWFYAQFLAVQNYLQESRAVYLSTTLDQMPLKGFDITLSMGVLYHRRDPISFITELGNSIHSGGQLVIETMVVDGDEQTVYMPLDRYAGMRNVWFLPSVAALSRWLERLGYHIDYAGEGVTTTADEQHRTSWMTNYSFTEFMQMAKYDEPPVKRAIIIATKL